jgi:hypothetical protein
MTTHEKSVFYQKQMNIRQNIILLHSAKAN